MLCVLYVPASGEMFSYSKQASETSHVGHQRDFRCIEHVVLHNASATTVAVACRVTSSMEPPALPRTLSPIWHDIPAYAGNAEQMEEYLSGELTRYFDVSSCQVVVVATAYVINRHASMHHKQHLTKEPWLVLFHALSTHALCTYCPG